MIHFNVYCHPPPLCLFLCLAFFVSITPGHAFSIRSHALDSFPRLCSVFPPHTLPRSFLSDRFPPLELASSRLAWFHWEYPERINYYPRLLESPHAHSLTHTPYDAPWILSSFPPAHRYVTIWTVLLDGSHTRHNGSPQSLSSRLRSLCAGTLRLSNSTSKGGANSSRKIHTLVPSRPSLSRWNAGLSLPHLCIGSMSSFKTAVV